MAILVTSQEQADKIIAEEEAKARRNAIMTTRQEDAARTAALKREREERIAGNIKKTGRRTTILAGENKR